MTFDEYQKVVNYDEFADADDKSVTSISFTTKTLGLVGEAGEYAEKIKKILRNNKGKISKQEEIELIKELGDVLWYVAANAKYLGYELKEVAEMNVRKLEDRNDRGVIASQGDNR